VAARATLILGARVVESGRTEELDVLVRGERIEQVGRGIPAPEGAEIVEAEGKLLLPGLIDDQVHFREPGLTRKACIATESRAAVAGGITSYMEMPNTDPPAVTEERLAEKRAIAARDSLANYAFYLGATPDNAGEIARMDRAATPGVKVFMGSSTGSLLVDREEDLRKIFSAAPGVVALHCEDDSIIARNAEALRKQGREPGPADHPRIRSREACLASTQKAIALAKETGARIHVLHITTREELDLFGPGPPSGKQVTSEACLHHLHFDDSAYGRLGNRVKCNPAIKEAEDRARILQAVADGRIDVLATDHAPHTLEEKERPYPEAPAGLPLVQFATPMLLKLAEEGPLTIETAVAKYCHAPAELFGIRDRGHVREGYWADLVLADPRGETLVEREKLLYRCGWSPLEGERFASSVDAVWVNGRKACAEGRIAEGAPGRPLEFGE